MPSRPDPSVATSERDLFLTALAKTPDDATLHGAYADWLDERGEFREATFQREFGQFFLDNPGVFLHLNPDPSSLPYRVTNQSATFCGAPLNKRNAFRMKSEGGGPWGVWVMDKSNGLVRVLTGLGWHRYADMENSFRWAWNSELCRLKEGKEARTFFKPAWFADIPKSPAVAVGKGVEWEPPKFVKRPQFPGVGPTRK